jgi:hypothetical protein
MTPEQLEFWQQRNRDPHRQAHADLTPISWRFGSNKIKIIIVKQMLI